MLAFDRRTVFFAMGVVGVVRSGIWFLLYHDPRRTVLTGVDHDYLADNRANANPVEMRQWRRLFRFRFMWGLMLGAFCGGYAVWMYQTWLPAYPEMQQHISIENTGYLASIPLICSILGALSGGYVSDRMAARGVELVASRRMPSILGLGVSGIFTFVATYGDAQSLSSRRAPPPSSWPCSTGPSETAQYRSGWPGRAGP